MWFALLAVLFAIGTADETRTGPGYTYFCSGNCTDVSPPTLPGVVLMGGGTDVDEAFVWLVQRAGGGNVLVLRAGPPGDDAYDPYIRNVSACQSAATLIITDAAANDEPFVLATILAAEGIFIAGGDQFQYYSVWQTQGGIAAAVNKVASRVTIGGTSAGMAVLGGIVFTAQFDTVESGSALADPLQVNISLADDFLALYPPWLGWVLTDMHFVTRDRMGRLVAFMANAIHRGWTPRGFACNEKTAVLLDGATGVGRVVGQGPAYALSYSEGPSVLQEGEPLSWEEVTVQKLEARDLFSFRDFKRLDRQVPPYTLSVKSGKLTSSTGSIY
jgi:cyanophycinase